MNKKLYIFLAALVMVLSLSSCYDDKSTLDSLSIDEIIIESGNMPDILRVDYYGEVKFEPTVKMGAEVNPTNVTYKWEINQTPDNVSFVEIGDERVLETTITNPILSAAYTLILTVRDEKYGLEYQKSWPLFVSSAFREGIVVADTKDGQTSDLNLIMDNEITTSYDKGKFVFYNIWEQILGEKRPALIKSIDYTLHKPSALLTKNVITAIYDDKNIEMIDCEDYSLHKNKDQILPGFGSDFTPQKFQTINNAYWMLIGNNIPYVTASNQATSAFLLPVSGVKGADNAVAVADNSDGGGVLLHFGMIMAQVPSILLQ